MKKLLTSIILMLTTTIAFAQNAEWSVMPGPIPNTTAFVNQDKTGGLVCHKEHKQCIVFVQDNECIERNTVPALFNSTKNAGVFPANCDRNLRALTGSQSVTELALQAQKVSIAWPSLNTEKINLVTLDFKTLPQEELYKLVDKTI